MRVKIVSTTLGPAVAAAILLALFLVEPCLASDTGHGGGGVDFPPSLQSYGDADQGVLGRMSNRISANPFNLLATVIFALAIVHTFLSARFRTISHYFEDRHAKRLASGEARRNSTSHGAELFHFLGEIEVVFGLWCIPLLVAMFVFFDWATVMNYVSHRVNYTEPMFVVVIMTLASTRPILKLSESAMDFVAQRFGGSLTAWWLTILTVGPLLGSFITEPAAMTICALLLVKKFYVLQPSAKLKYATLGLLFVNISVGGTLTHFAAPPVLMVADAWSWGTLHMMANFGWKAAIGIGIANALYWYAFRGEFAGLREGYEIREAKERVLLGHLAREAAERAVDEVSAEVEKEQGVLQHHLVELVERYSTEIKARLWAQVQAQMKEMDVDPAIAEEAFEQRFEEVKRARLQREFPQMLEPEDRAKFLDPNWDQREDPVPKWVMAVHVVFMAWTIFNAHHPVFFVSGLLFFLGFAAVTADAQNRIDLKPALLVGFFLGGLVTHGGLQGWWIEPVLGSLSEYPLAFAATVLTAFNDNAAITYLATLVPDFTDSLKYAVVAGAVTGGGLTVIANAPNPAGQAILNRHFENGINPLGLLKAALVPTVVMFLMFMLFA